MSASVAVRPSLFGRLYEWLHALIAHAPANRVYESADTASSMIRREPAARISSQPLKRNSVALADVAGPAVDEAAARAVEIITVAPVESPSLARAREIRAVGASPIAARLQAVQRLNAGLVKAQSKTSALTHARTGKPLQHHRPVARTAVKAPRPAAARAGLKTNRPVVYAYARAA